MKKILELLFILFILITLTSCAKKDVVETDLYKSIKNNKSFVVGINENSRPFAYLNNEGELVGFDVDLIKEISKYIFDTDKIIKFKNVTPSNRILKLTAKEVDVVISTMTINQERRLVVDFSNPYFMSGQALMVKANSNIRSGKDLNYKNVGIVLGTTAASNIRYIAPYAHIVGFKNYKDAFAELQNNNIEAISKDDTILQGILDENKNYKILQDRYSTEFYGIALRKDLDSQQLKVEINEALMMLEKSGKLVKLEQKYNVHYRRSSK